VLFVERALISSLLAAEELLLAVVLKGGLALGAVGAAALLGYAAWSLSRDGGGGGGGGKGGA
jgi:hypothetical protein